MCILFSIKINEIFKKKLNIFEINNYPKHNIIKIFSK